MKEDVAEWAASLADRSTDSPAFKRWFGDSKVVDAEGRPLVVYHGTAHTFDAFDADNGMAWASEGFRVPELYADSSAYYADRDPETEGGGENVIPLLMRITKPFDADLGLPKSVGIDQILNAMVDQAGRPLSETERLRMQEIFGIVRGAAKREESGPRYSRHDFWYEASSLFGQDGAAAIRAAFDMLGFDGIKMVENGEQTWGAFSPTQIKSIFNRGTWDGTDPRMLHEDAIDPARYDTLATIFTDAVDGVNVAQSTDSQLFGHVIMPLVDIGMTRDEVAALRPYLERFISDLKARRLNKEPGPETALDRLNAVLPGWSGVNGMLTNPDPARGGIIDRRIADKKWFVILNGSTRSADGLDTVDQAVDWFIENHGKAAQPKPEPRVVFNDRENIDKTLPLLLPEQRDDVAKIEARFAKPDGHGMLITNGTGTGKTYTGMGAIKRFYQAGKKNILIVAPSDAVIAGWVKTGDALGVPVTQLRDTNDAGRDVSVTTYANLAANSALASRDFDLIVSDESQNLMSNAAGETTGNIEALRAVSMHPRGLGGRWDMQHADDWARAKRMPDGDAKNAAMRRLWDQRQADQQKWAAQPRPKVLFLSATPWAYDKTVDYTEGYLFSYPEDQRIGNSNQTGRAAFFVRNFGYRIRYHKLTKPEHAVDSAVFERDFHEKLKREGVLSGRSLQIDVDYDRRFVRKTDTEGNRLDEALEALDNLARAEREAAQKAAKPGERVPTPYAALQNHMSKNFDYLERQKLLEAIKARMAVPEIEKHLAMGRKVVVFHDFNVGGGFNPFTHLKTREVVINPETGETAEVPISPMTAEASEGYRNLLAAHPWIAKLNFSGYRAPIEAIPAALGDRARLFNGRIPTKQRLQNLADFNTDGSGADVLVVQADAGGAGISMHDTTGKHQRVLINLGMPTKPTTTLQQEGRILRVGTKTNAPFRYFTIGTGWERQAFAKRIAERSGTVENLALGNEARDLMNAFIDAYMDSSDFAPSDQDGIGGKVKDNRAATITPYDRAKSHYYGRPKITGRRDQRDGVDFYATAEPLAFKMVEWAGIRANERVLEPSAGDGAIARYMPDDAAITLVEPSTSLGATAQLRAPKASLIDSTFENYYVGNKHHVIIMNPPFGAGGATAVAHLAKAARHLRPGGRIVALIPTGPAADKRFDAWWEGDDAKNLNMMADVALPSVAFERAGTGVMTRVVVIDKPADQKEARSYVGMRGVDLTGARTVADFFDRLENISLMERPAPVADVLDQLEAEGQDATSPSPALRPGPALVGEVGAFTKTTWRSSKGRDYPAAFHKARVERDLYDQLKDVAGRFGGWFGRGGARTDGPTFAFRTAADRDAFIEATGRPTVGMEETAYHGGPHDFDQFGLEHIGKGEGAQVYGWGLYFASRRGVAEWYRDKLSNRMGRAFLVDGRQVGAGWIGHMALSTAQQNVPFRTTNFQSGLETYHWYSERFRQDVVSALMEMEADITRGQTPVEAFDFVSDFWLKKEPPYADEAESVERLREEFRKYLRGVTATKPGRLYTVDIPGPDSVMDWDATILNQPSQVQERLSPVLNAIRSYYRGKEKALNGGLEGFMRNLTGREVIDFLQEHGATYGFEPDGYTFTRRIEPKISHVIHEVRMSSTGNKIGEGDGRKRALRDALIRDDEYASLALRKLGIPGHRYLDGVSRGAGDGSHNYVIYDDAAITIIQKEQRAQMVREAAAATEEIRRLFPALRAELDRLNLKRVKLTQAEGKTNGWQGMFKVTGDGEMEIIIGASLNPMKTLHHEVIHALRAMNLFTPEEWKALKLAAHRSWYQKHDIMARYSSGQGENVPLYSMLSAEQELEEAIAEEFSEALAKRQAPKGSILVTAFNKIARLFRAFRNVLNGAGFQTTEDIFGRVLSGEIGARQAGNTGAGVRFQRKPDAAMGDLFAPPAEPAKGGMTEAQRAEMEARAMQSKMRKVGGNSGDAGPLFNDDPVMFQRQPLAVRPLTPYGRAVRNSGIGGAPFVPDRRVWETITRNGLSIWKTLQELPGAAVDAVDRARFTLQDRFLPVYRAQQAIMQQTGRPLPADQDAYLAETLYSGGVGRELLDIDEKFTKPIVRLMAASQGRLTMDDVGVYLYARHAQERNAYIASINPQMPDGGSGMTNADAQQVLADAAAHPDAAAFAQIGTLIDQLREFTIQSRVAAGLLSPADAALWRQQYAHYVPLRGWDETDHAESILDLRGARIGRQFSVRGKESQRALGRSSLAFNPLQGSITMAQEVAVRGGRNKVAQSLYRLAAANPSPYLWEVKAPKQKRYFNRTTGLVETRIEQPATTILEPNEIAVKIDGKEHRILFHDERIARAVGTLGADQLDALSRVMGKFSRFFSMVNTTLSPAFVVTNAFRDFGLAQVIMAGMRDSKAGFQLTSDQRHRIMAAMAKNWPKAFRGILRGQNYRFTGTWAQHFDEFQKAGAQVWFWKMDSAEAGQNDMAARLKLARGNLALRGLKHMAPSAFFSERDNPVLHLVNSVNLAVDNAIRLAAFAQARQEGLTVEQAAYMAKELTVNFNRRGRYGAVMNAWFPFSNAAIQGTTRLFEALRNPALLAGLTVGGIGLGIVQDMVNAALSDEDDDGELLYDKIPNYRLERSIQIPDGSGGQTNWAVPVAYGVNVFTYAGSQISKVMRGVKPADRAFGDVMAAAASSFMPTDTAVPTVIQPTVDVWRNRDFFGRSVYPEDLFGDNKYLPESSKFFPSVSDFSRVTTRELNAVTGGNEVEAGAIDISPEVMDHYLGFIFGSAGRFWGNSADALSKALQGRADEIEMRQIPLASAVRSEVSPYEDKDRFRRFSLAVEDAVHDVEAAQANPRLAGRIDQGKYALAKLKPLLATARREIRGTSEFNPKNSKFVRPSRDERTVIMEFNREYLKVAGRQAN